MASSECNMLNVTMGHKLFSYLERKPQNYDVSFSVGPQKIVVKALKVILKSSSAVFEREFEEKWENAVLKEGEGIPLHDVDADTFKLFIKLMIMDTWSIEAIKELNLSADQLFNLLSICRKYDMTLAVQTLDELSQDFLSNFDSYIKTDEFLTLSQANFETILGSEDIALKEVKVFDVARRWAEYQCTANAIDPTGTNIREALGGCLFKIRFPTMTNVEFTKVIELRNLLTLEETVEIYRFIGTSDKQSVNTDDLPFLTNIRVSVDESLAPKDCLTLSLATKFDVYSNSFFDGTEQCICIKTRKRIAVYGLGFLGPVDSDASYNVRVRITRIMSYNENGEMFAPVTKQFSVAKNKKFYFLFDVPVTLDPFPISDKWSD